MEETIDAAVEQDNIDNPETTEEKREVTVGDILDTPPEPRVVPESVLIATKKKLKEAEKALKAARETKDDSEDIDFESISDKYDVDSNLLKDLAKVVGKQNKKDFEEVIAPKLAKLEEKERAEAFNNQFNKYFDESLEAMPELKGVVNKEVIKQLALNPANSKKTVAELVEETYGNAVAGKRSIDPSNNSGGRDTGKLDRERMGRDPEYAKQVFSDPELKKQYNEGIEKRILF